MDKTKNVLIVEDLPSHAELAEREILKVLPEAIFEVVDNKEKYIKALTTFKPDLIISDYQMPTFDGLTALTIRNETIPDVPFIVLTGSVNEEVAVTCLKSGADDYVIKEHIKRLGQAILNAINKKLIEDERKLIEDQLKLVSAAVEQSPVAIMIADKAGDLVYVNPAFEEYTGYTFDEAIGENPRFLKSGYTSPEEYKVIWETISSGEQWSGEFKNKRKDDTFFWESATIAPIRRGSGEISHYLAVKEDITERRKMITELMLREEKYRTLTHNLNIGVYRNGVGDNGKFIEGNPAFLKILGLRNKKEFDLYRVVDFYPDPEIKTAIEKKLADQGFILNEELQFRRKDGELFYASVSITAVTNEDGKIIFYDGIIEDITEKKAVQDNILIQRNEMEALNNQLIDMEEESKRELALALHDGLGQYLSLAKLKIAELKKEMPIEDENKLLNEVLENVQNAIDESRNLTYELNPPMLNEFGLIPTIEWKADIVAKQNNLKVEIIDRTEGYVLDDKYYVCLYRAISEVFQNVVKHSKAKEIKVTFLVQDKSYTIEISDNGIGFDFQTVRTKAIKEKKFGIYSIMERMRYLGGNFDIDTGPNKGTKAIITLPV